MKDNNKLGVDIDTAHREVVEMVENSVNFLFSEFEDNWARAEKYYGGGTDLPSVAGRSQVVKTVVRDSIRAVKPSVMRTLLQCRRIVEYSATQNRYSEWAEQQGDLATQTFWRCDGYRQLMSAFDTAAKLKAGPMKVYWLEKPQVEYFERRYVPEDMLEALVNDPEVQILSTEMEIDPILLEKFPDMMLYKVTANRVKAGGELKIEAVPMYEFFVDRNASSMEDAEKNYVHGQRRVVSVGEAIELGLECDDWRRLDVEDPEQSEYSNSSYYRRRYTKDGSTQKQADLSQHEFLLTEAYRRVDLDGDGVGQLYCFWLGGTSYELLDYQLVEFSPFEVVSIDPVPFTVIGTSLADLTVEEQDMNTSIVRAIADNFHMSNNPRFAGDPKRVNFDDLVNTAVGAPVRVKTDTQVQILSIPFTGQSGLPLLEYLDRDVEDKVGYTKAATGLDPNAMQSTDKQAVQNTIQLSQGQIELIVRNVIETCLIPLFKKLLRLQVAYGEPVQLIKAKGSLLPVPMGVINPDLAAEPTVGLGTGADETKVAALQGVINKQEMLMEKYGLNNPFTSLAQIYTAYEDLADMTGLTNFGRYMNVITPQHEQELAQKQAAAAEEAKKNAPPQPHELLARVEEQKNELNKQKAILDHREKTKVNELNALIADERADLERDKLIQTREIELAKINAGLLNEKIKAEQATNDADKVSERGTSSNSPTVGGSTSQ